MDAIYLFLAIFSLGTYLALWVIRPHERREITLAGITGAVVMAALIMLR